MHSMMGSKATVLPSFVSPGLLWLIVTKLGTVPPDLTVKILYIKSPS